VIHVDSQWRKDIASNSSADSGVDIRQAARDLLTVQDKKLEEIHQKAVTSGVSVTLQVRSLEDPADQPYSA
jgi:hypothetical protein